MENQSSPTISISEITKLFRIASHHIAIYFAFLPLLSSMYHKSLLDPIKQRQASISNYIGREIHICIVVQSYSFFFFLEVVLATIAASTLMENNPSSSRTDRKTIERNRRNQMKALYSQLNSLVPHQSSRVSIPPSILFTRYCCTLPNMKALL